MFTNLRIFFYLSILIALGIIIVYLFLSFQPFRYPSNLRSLFIYSLKTKIVHITQSLGGVRTYLENIFYYSNPKMFEYVIIAPEHSEFQEFCRQHNVTYYPVKIQRSIHPFKDVAAFFNILKILKAERPNIIQTHSAKGGFIGRFAAKFTNAKVIYCPHAFSYLSFKGLKRMIFYGLESISKSWVDVLLAVSHSEANRAIYELGYEESAVRTVLNAVKVDSNVPFRNYHRCVNIGMIGRLTHQKNPILFLTVAAELCLKYPWLEFSILGAGMTDHLTSEIDEFLINNQLLDRIHILQWGDSATSRQFLSDMDIFVMTSVFEGLPFSLIEAMSIGLPSVVSKVDGNTDVIQNNENGLACLTVDEFTNKISMLVESEDLRRKLGLAGHRYVEEFHEIHANTRQLEALYRELLYGKPKKEQANGGGISLDEQKVIANLKLSTVV